VSRSRRWHEGTLGNWCGKERRAREGGTGRLSEDERVAAHELGAAACAIKAARAGAPEGEGEAAGRHECRWQRDQLPDAIRELVLDDQRLRNDICWSVFEC
jgi:hypothetical protein